MNPIENPEAYLFAKIGGATWPGDVTFSGAGIERAWKKNKGSGSSGATISFEGEDLGEFEMLLEAYTVEHFRAWESTFRDMLLNAPTDKALELDYPTLVEIGLTSFVTKNKPAMEKTDPLGKWGWKFKCSQYRAPAPAAGTPNGSSAPGAGTDGTANGGAGQPPPPTDPVDQTIEDLTEEFNNEAAGGTAP